MKIITLFTKSDLDYCRTTFRSVRAGMGGQMITVLNDGSLTDAECTELQTELGEGFRVVSRSEADKCLGGHLRLGARLSDLVNRRPVLMKLLHVDVLSDGGDYLFVDADVIFTRAIDVEALRGSLSKWDSAISLNPRFCAYSFRPTDARRVRGSIFKANSGVFYQRAGLDVAAAAASILQKSEDSYLERPWLEQSTRAQIYGEFNCGVFARDDVYTPKPFSSVKDWPPVCHCMGGFRDALTRDVSLSRLNQLLASSGKVQIRINEAKHTTMLRYLADYLAKRISDRIWLVRRSFTRNPIGQR